MRQATQQNQMTSMNGQQNCMNNMPNSAILTSSQMNFDFNANGLELAGFCSPPGILMEIFHYVTVTDKSFFF
jgi:hypothetical protein